MDSFNKDIIETIDKYVNGQLSGAALKDFQAKMKEDADLREKVKTYQENLWIEQYVKDTISNKDKIIVEQNIKEDADFAKAIALEQQLRQNLKAAARLEAVLATVEKIEQAEKDTQSTRLKWFIGGVLILLLLLVLFFLLNIDLDKPTIENLDKQKEIVPVDSLPSDEIPLNDVPSNLTDPTKKEKDTIPTKTVPIAETELSTPKTANSTNYLALFEANMKTPISTVSTLRSVKTNEKAFQAYDAKNYSLALTAFTQLIEQDTNVNMEFIFYAAICQLELDKNQEAINNFKTIIADNNSIFVRKAKWYLALTYLKMGEIKSAETVLKQIKPTNRTYYESAQKLLEDLK